MILPLYMVLSNTLPDASIETNYHTDISLAFSTTLIYGESPLIALSSVEIEDS